jgi:hypothetical protein
MITENMKGERSFPSLASETRATVPTSVAAFHLNRKDQTLRCWAAYQNGPIQPLRIYGRLAWPVAEIRRLVGVEPKAR